MTTTTDALARVAALETNCPGYENEGAWASHEDLSRLRQCAADNGVTA